MTSQSAEDSPTGAPLPPLTPPSPPSPPRSSRRRQRVAFQMPDFDDVEDVGMYRRGGYHPVNIDDVVGNRYKIINKLGNGGFALVWLARDLEQDRNVALKILKANALDREVQVLEHLKDVAGNVRITKLQEMFTIRGPNGSHQCLVLQLGGPSLKHVFWYCRNLPYAFLQAAARNLVEGIAALHAAGVCHGGFQDWTEDEICLHLGPPRTAPLLLLDGTPAPAFAPTHVVDALDYSHLDTEHLSNHLFISDFGQAFFKDNVPTAIGTPASFSAPELLFGYQPSCAVDLWALGCLIFEIHTAYLLILTAFGSDEEALAMAIETIGALPGAWQGSYKGRFGPDSDDNTGKKHRWYDDQLERVRTLDSQILKELPELSKDQRDTFYDLLRTVLVFEPGRRLPASEVVRHPWFSQNLENIDRQHVPKEKPE